MHKIYEKYVEYALTGRNEEARYSIYTHNPADNIRGSQYGESEADKLGKMRMYRELFKVLIDIADVIMNQIFEKIATIPYTIR